MEFIAYDPSMRAGLVAMFKNNDAYYKDGMLSLIDEHPHNAIVLEHDGTILSAAAHTAERGDKRANFSAYTGERFRHEGIGQTIAKATICNMIGLGVRKMYADFPKSDIVAGFAKKVGLRVAFDSHYMTYTGGRMSADTRIVPYSPDMLDACHAITDPELCCSRNADDCFVFIDGGDIVGTGCASNGELLCIAVRAESRRSGIGRALAAYGINKLIDEGCNEISLWVRDDNANARALCDSMGFKIARTNTYCALELP